MNSADKVHEIQVTSRNEQTGKETPVTIKITVQDGNIASIEATGGGKTYEGQLTLSMMPTSPSSEGGDECIVCNPQCHEVIPCPKPPE